MQYMHLDLENVPLPDDLALSSTQLLVQCCSFPSWTATTPSFPISLPPSSELCILSRMLQLTLSITFTGSEKLPRLLATYSISAQNKFKVLVLANSASKKCAPFYLKIHYVAQLFYNVKDRNNNYIHRYHLFYQSQSSLVTAQTSNDCWILFLDNYWFSLDLSRSAARQNPPIIIMHCSDARCQYCMPIHNWWSFIFCSYVRMSKPGKQATIKPTSVLAVSACCQFSSIL